MLRIWTKVIFLSVVAMAVRQVTLVSGLKCYKCIEEKKDMKICLAPNNSMVDIEVQGQDPTPGVLHCYVSVFYEKISKQNINGVLRYSANVVVSDKAELAKTGHIVMADCSDLKKFPKPVLHNPELAALLNVTVEYYHGCYCAKDLCNSAIIPNK